MKTEQEFLTALWSDIHAREWEAQQKQRAHEMNKRLFIKELCAYGLLLALLAAGSGIAFLFGGNSAVIYAFAILLYIGAFLVERVIYVKSQEVTTYETRI